jgi:hypothetical protein
LVLEATAEFENNIQALTQAMMGACYYSGGKWRMAAGAWSSSAFSITEDDIVGQVTVQTAQSRKREGYYNAVRGQFVDKDRNYQPVEFEPILNSTYESEDGERIYTEVAFPACNNQYEAQRNAIILSRQSRRQKTVQVVCSLNAYKIRPFETGTVTIAEVGWTNQTVRCIGWKFRPEPAIELTLIEASSTDYSDPSTGTYVTPASVVISDPATYSPGSPQSFTATQEIESILQCSRHSVPCISIHSVDAIFVGHADLRRRRHAVTRAAHRYRNPLFLGAVVLWRYWRYIRPDAVRRGPVIVRQDCHA